MYIVYNILILIVLVFFVLPYYTYRLFTEKGFALRFKEQVFGNIAVSYTHLTLPTIRLV